MRLSNHIERSAIYHSGCLNNRQTQNSETPNQCRTIVARRPCHENAESRFAIRAHFRRDSFSAPSRIPDNDPASRGGGVCISDFDARSVIYSAQSADKAFCGSS
jgi:hypothetical protein